MQRSRNTAVPITTRLDIHNIMLRFTLFFALILSICTCGLANGTVKEMPKGGTSLFDRWAKQETLAIELHINMDSLEVHRKKTDFLPAAVVADGQRLDLEVAVRGRFRRRTCEMPPLKLKFSKDGLRDRGLNTHNDFKLVTHCTDDAAGREAIAREQLVYDLYRTINPAASFRTQLLEVTYVNTVDGKETKSLAIMIEDYDELQNRLALDSCKECYGATPDQFTNLEELTLFQYMIGNADWDAKMLRNTKILRGEAGTMTAVPYDFDFSAVVGADYATPFSYLGQTKVTDRVLVWNYDAPADLSGAEAKFLRLQDTLLGQVEAAPGLSKRGKREVRKYLGEFFEGLEVAASK